MQTKSMMLQYLHYLSGIPPPQRFAATNLVHLRVVRAQVSHCWLVNAVEAREEDDWEFHHLYM